MTTPYDALPADVRREAFGWFGEPWPSFICYDEENRLIAEMRKSFPAGESCLFCAEAFDEAASDSGTAMPSPEGIRHAHKECLFMNVAGSLAHHEGRCRCHGGTGETPGMTLRQEALEVWRRHHEGTLHGR